MAASATARELIPSRSRSTANGCRTLPCHSSRPDSSSMCRPCRHTRRSRSSRNSRMPHSQPAPWQCSSGPERTQSKATMQTWKSSLKSDRKVNQCRHDVCRHGSTETSSDSIPPDPIEHPYWAGGNRGGRFPDECQRLQALVLPVQRRQPGHCQRSIHARPRSGDLATTGKGPGLKVGRWDLPRLKLAAAGRSDDSCATIRRHLFGDGACDGKAAATVRTAATDGSG